jgi:Cation transporter/ATPase, N-terminus
VALLLDTPSIVDDPREAVELLLRELRARPDGLSSREAERRLVAYGRNEISRR